MLTFTDMSGVFYCVLFGMVGSFLVLLAELLIESHKDTKRNNKEVLYRRFHKYDILKSIDLIPILSIELEHAFTRGLSEGNFSSANILNIFPCKSRAFIAS